MAKFRIDLLMNMTRYGWSETYYREAASLASAGTIALTLATIRTPLCNINCKVDGWRITPLSDFGIPNGRALIMDAGPHGITGAQPAARDEQDVGVLTRFADTSNQFRKSLWLRGLPDSSTEFFLNGNPNFTPQFNVVFNAFTNYLRNNSFLLRNFDLNPATNPPRSVLLIQFAVNGEMSVNLDDSLVGLTAGMRVKISGYKGRFGSRVNGIAKVTGISGAAFNVLSLDKESCEFKNQNGGGNGASVRLERYTMPVINTAASVRFTKRNTGRAFFVSPGRRSRKGQCLVTRVARPSIF